MNIFHFKSNADDPFSKIATSIFISLESNLVKHLFYIYIFFYDSGFLGQFVCTFTNPNGTCNTLLITCTTIIVSGGGGNKKEAQAHE
jgi:hypothetical protein